MILTIVLEVKDETGFVFTRSKQSGLSELAANLL